MTDAVFLVQPLQLRSFRRRDDVLAVGAEGLQAEPLADDAADPFAGDFLLVVLPVAVYEPTGDLLDREPSVKG